MLFDNPILHIIPHTRHPALGWWGATGRPRKIIIIKWKSMCIFRLRMDTRLVSTCWLFPFPFLRSLTFGFDYFIITLDYLKWRIVPNHNRYVLPIIQLLIWPSLKWPDPLHVSAGKRNNSQTGNIHLLTWRLSGDPPTKIKQTHVLDSVTAWPSNPRPYFRQWKAWWWRHSVTDNVGRNLWVDMGNYKGAGIVEIDSYRIEDVARFDRRKKAWLHLRKSTRLWALFLGVGKTLPWVGLCFAIVHSPSRRLDQRNLSLYKGFVSSFHLLSESRILDYVYPKVTGLLDVPLNGQTVGFSFFVLLHMYFDDITETQSRSRNWLFVCQLKVDERNQTLSADDYSHMNCSHMRWYLETRSFSSTLWPSFFWIVIM